MNQLNHIIMRKLVFTDLAAVFMWSSGFSSVEKEIDNSDKDLFLACSCTVSYYSWHMRGDSWVYGPVSASAMVRDAQACNQWGRETGPTSAVYDSENCENIGNLLNGIKNESISR